MLALISDGLNAKASLLNMNLLAAISLNNVALGVMSLSACVVAGGIAWAVLRFQRNELKVPDVGARTAFADRRLLLLALGAGYIVVAASVLWSMLQLLAVFLLGLAIGVIGFILLQGRQNRIYAQLTRVETLQQKLDAATKDSRQKAELLRTLAHDLRNPLGAVSLHAEIASLKLEKAEHDEVAEALENIHLCATETKQILSDFLEVSRMQWDEESVNIAAVDATRLVHEIVSTVTPQAESKGLELKSDIEPDATLFTDRSKLYRIILNLLHNAVKYTSTGRINVNLSSNQSTIFISICDTGPGIDKEKLPHLFDEFYQVADVDHDPRDGFGLGLTITRKLVQQLGGTLSVESEIDQGCTFTVAMPRSFAAPRSFTTSKQAPAA